MLVDKIMAYETGELEAQDTLKFYRIKDKTTNEIIETEQGVKGKNKI